VLYVSVELLQARRDDRRIHVPTPFLVSVEWLLRAVLSLHGARIRRIVSISISLDSRVANNSHVILRLCDFALKEFSNEMLIQHLRCAARLA
jgi:hypothetical protein